MKLFDVEESAQDDLVDMDSQPKPEPKQHFGNKSFGGFPKRDGGAKVKGWKV